MVYKGAGMKFGIIELSQPDKDVEKYPYREVHERVTKEIIEAETQLRREYDKLFNRVDVRKELF